MEKTAMKKTAMKRTAHKHSCGMCLLLLVALLFATSCATYRGMPTHGGGKRFDEEQRVVSASIRHAVQRMDISSIKSKRVALDVTSLETSGTGQPFYPGLGNVNLTAGFADTNSMFDRINQPPIPGTAGTNFTNSYISHDDVERLDARITNQYQFNPSLRANNNITRQDIEYLVKTLEMRLRQESNQIVGPNNAEVLLVVLVDVLGTNLSRIDYGLAYTDDLSASCEMTYYAINPKNQLVLRPSMSVASVGQYTETNLRFSPFRRKTRSVGQLDSKIIPLFAGTEQANALEAVEINGNPKLNKSAHLDALYQRALVELDANNKKAATDTIREIRKIAPKYQNLPELQLRLEEM